MKIYKISFIDNRLVDTTVQLRSENLKLSVENEKLQSGILPTYGGGNSNENTSSKIQALEKKLMAQQEELTSLHKRKGENSQMIVDLNLKVTEQMKSMTEKDNWFVEFLLIWKYLLEFVFFCVFSLAEQSTTIHSLKAEVLMYITSIDELKGINTMLRDEHSALQLAFTSLEDKYRKFQVNFIFSLKLIVNFQFFFFVVFKTRHVF